MFHYHECPCFTYKTEIEPKLVWTHTFATRELVIAIQYSEHQGSYTDVWRCSILYEVFWRCYEKWIKFSQCSIALKLCWCRLQNCQHWSKSCTIHLPQDWRLKWWLSVHYFTLYYVLYPKIEDSEMVIDEDFGPFDSFGFILSIDCPH